MYELDGRRAGPVNHGPAGGDLLTKAAQVIRTCYMEQDPSSMMWNMMALSKTG